MSRPKILIVAAEASSALYAQRLLEHWRNEGRDVEAFGVGSRAMESLGFERLGRSEEMAVVGLQEVLAHFKDIKAVFDRLVEAAASRKPDAVLLLDYPDFNLRLAARMKSLGLPVIYYISPQLWAWRTGRVKKIKESVAKMLVLFPFEKEFYRDHGVDVEFVGHPLLDEIRDELFAAEFQESVRKKHGLVTTSPLLGLMPGSRKSEIRHHLKAQLQTARVMCEANPYLQVALLLAPELEESLIAPELDANPVKVRVIQDEPFAMIAAMDALLVASGTATLMVGLMEKPMAIMYKMNSFSAMMAKRLVNKVSHFGMVNLISQKEVVPEFFQGQVTAEKMAPVLNRLLSETVERDSMIRELKNLKGLLGSRGATERVAQELEAFFK